MSEKSKKETRVLNLDTSKLAVELREDGTTKISGYAAVFNSDSEDMGFVERIKPGAFKAALRKSDVRVLFNHDANLIIGRSGVNLSLKEDKKGLFMEVSPLATSTYRMVSENIQAGLVTQQSFAFTVADDEWNDDYTKREIKKVDQIYDVSPVTYPAYADTSVALRCRKDAMEKRERPQSTIEVTDGETVFAFEDIEQFDRVAAKITELRGAQPPESPTADTDETGANPTAPTSEEPQTAEELDLRYLAIINKRKGF